MVKEINMKAVPVLIYTAGFINCKQAELEAIDHKTEKIMAVHHSFLEVVLIIFT